MCSQPSIAHVPLPPCLSVQHLWQSKEGSLVIVWITHPQMHNCPVQCRYIECPCQLVSMQYCSCHRVDGTEWGTIYLIVYVHTCSSEILPRFVQKHLGRCNAGWMRDTSVFIHGYCAKTCGVCKCGTAPQGKLASGIDYDDISSPLIPQW